MDGWGEWALNGWPDDLCGAAEDRGAGPNSCGTNKGRQYLYLRDFMYYVGHVIKALTILNISHQCAVTDQN